MTVQMEFEVAIVGGSIIGVVVAISIAVLWLSRDWGRRRPYCQRHGFMKLIYPRIVDAVNLVATPGGYGGTLTKHYKGCNFARTPYHHDKYFANQRSY